jgi:hypothetical protein
MKKKQIKNEINEEWIKIWVKRQHNWKFRDLIKLSTSLINQIKGLIGELISFET